VFDRRRPNPDLGVFETMLVLDGRPVELDAHLARLAASLAELFPRHTPPALDVPGTSSGALRIAVAPGADGRLAATIECRPTNGHFATDNGGQSFTEAVSLGSLRLTGGLGAHKWADRSLLDEAQRNPDDALPLIVDEDGSVLEASRANLFAVRHGTLHTPPTDGRILPGVTRMRVLTIAAEIGIEANESGLSRDDLFAADEVFLTGSVRGIEPASSLDGAPLPGGGPIAERLSVELRRAWTGLKTATSFG
jgi:para-aminobenzoate synthetase / 4-amino-4-deoxychorismate lyase